MAVKGSKKFKEGKMVNNLRKSSTNRDDEKDEIKLQSQLLNSLQEKIAEMEKVRNVSMSYADQIFVSYFTLLSQGKI